MADLSEFNKDVEGILDDIKKLVVRVENAIDYGDKRGEWYPRKFLKRLRGQLLGVYKSVYREKK